MGKDTIMFTISYVVALSGQVKQIITDNPYESRPVNSRIIAVTMNEDV